MWWRRCYGRSSISNILAYPEAVKLAVRYYEKYSRARAKRGRKFSEKNPYIPAFLQNMKVSAYGTQMKERFDFFVQCMTFANYAESTFFLRACGCINGRMLNGLNQDQMRFLTNQVDDMTPEERARVEKENECCEPASKYGFEDEYETDFEEFVDDVYDEDNVNNGTTTLAPTVATNNEEESSEESESESSSESENGENEEESTESAEEDGEENGEEDEEDNWHKKW